MQKKICEIFILCICLNLFWNFRLCCSGIGPAGPGIIDNIGIVTTPASLVSPDFASTMATMKLKQQKQRRSAQYDSFPNGNIVLQATKDLINRSTGNGNSQVLSLNLTNLLIIALLKILVFAAGIIGANHFKQYGRHQEPHHYDFHYGN